MTNLMNILNSGKVEDVSIGRSLEEPSFLVVRNVDNVWLIDTMTGDVVEDLGFICPQCSAFEPGDAAVRINGKQRLLCPVCSQKHRDSFVSDVE